MAEDPAAELAALKAKYEAERRARLEAEARQRTLEQQVESSLLLRSAIDLSTERAKQLKTVDICFVFDCTASMQRYLKAAKQKIREIAKFVLESMGEGASLRFAIVGYRDIGDDEPLVQLPFTTELDPCERFLSDVRACGGGDICEDVLSGLDAAAELDWQGKVRMLFLISQTPNHGERFHDHPAERTAGMMLEHVFDAHRDIVQQWGYTDALMHHLRSLEVQLVCLEISDITKKMFGVFASLYDGAPGAEPGEGLTMQVVPMGSSPASFCDAVSRATWSSITASWTKVGTSMCTRLGRHAPLPPKKEVDVETASIDWEHMRGWKEMLVDIESYIVDPANGAVDLSKPEDAVKKTTVQHSVFLAPKPFGSGAMRLAYALFDKTTGSKLVAKEYAFQGEEWKSRAVFEGDMLSQAFAQYFAMEFSKRCDKTPVQFVQAQLMQPVGTSSADKLMAVEPYIPGSYEKFTTNASYVRPDSEIAQAFSHFTWHFTSGRMMVTDIQGVQTTLTDPQIHCAKPCFGQGNRGIKGMDDFFMVHKCGATCKHLGVKESPVQLSGRAPTLQTWPEQAEESDDSKDSNDGLKARLGGLGRLGLLEGLEGELMSDLKKLHKQFDHDRSIHDDAKRALDRAAKSDPESGQGRDWIGGILLAWTTPPTICDVKPAVNDFFDEPLQVGDELVKVEGRETRNLGRQEILKLLTESQPVSMQFARASAGKFADLLRSSAEQALGRAPEADPESGLGRDWIGGFLLAWTTPPTVRDAKPEASAHFKRPIEVGDQLIVVDGTDTRSLNRQEMLKLFTTTQRPGEMTFRSAERFSDLLRASAKQALDRAPEADPESGRGRDWIGGILLAWTTPPTVRDAKPEASDRFSETLQAGDRLDKVEGKDTARLNRQEILALLLSTSGPVQLQFGRTRTDRYEALQDNAKQALGKAPEADPESGQGRDWVGGILLAWTRPPTVRDVKPGVSAHFQHPIRAGDKLSSVDGTKVDHLGRREVLSLLAAKRARLGFKRGGAEETLRGLEQLCGAHAGGALGDLMSAHLRQLLEESTRGEGDQKSQTATPPEAVRVEGVTETTARVCWAQAAGQRQDVRSKVEVPAQAGSLVKRRDADWKWGDQDGGPGKRGTLLENSSPGVVRVKWDNGHENNYRAGAEGKFDLEYAQVQVRVAGAGGRGAVCNGVYVQMGMENDRPKYQQLDGDSIIYWSPHALVPGWKINDEDDTHGWFYSLRDQGSALGTLGRLFFKCGDEGSALPPEGQWTTDGYHSKDADPAPCISHSDAQDEHDGCHVEVRGPGNVLHFKQDCDGIAAEVDGLCAGTEYQAKVSRRVGGRLGKPAVVKFSTLAAQTFRPVHEEVVQILCYGKCGTFVDMPSGLHYLRQSKVGIFCERCQEKVDASMCETACAGHGCTNMVKFSKFQLACRGDKVPTLCKACDAMGLD